jgi:phosphoglycerate dehydrogenase-like enzyme
MSQQPDTTVSGTPIAVGPSERPDVVDAVLRGGGRIVEFAEAEGCVWLDLGDLDGFRSRMHPGLRWVQLPAAGIERWIDHIAGDTERTYTAATGAYSPQVAEHTLALLLAGARLLHDNARARTWEGREAREGTTLFDEDVLIVGCGGIGEALIELLVPFRSRVIAVTRSGRTVEGAAESHAFEDLPQLWGRARFIVLSAPLTDETRHVVDAAALGRMRPDAWIVNVGRGELIDTDALVAAVTSDAILGAALDVTAPEPLPDGHPLWDLERILITPHTANPKPLLLARLAERIEGNVRRFAAGEPLVGEVTPGAGY